MRGFSEGFAFMLQFLPVCGIVQDEKALIFEKKKIF